MKYSDGTEANKFKAKNMRRNRR